MNPCVTIGRSSDFLNSSSASRTLHTRVTNCSRHSAASAPHCAHTAAEAPHAVQPLLDVQARATAGVKDGSMSYVQELSQLWACLARHCNGSKAAVRAPPTMVAHQPSGPMAACTLDPVSSSVVRFASLCSSFAWQSTWVRAVYHGLRLLHRKWALRSEGLSGSVGHGGEGSRPAAAASVGTARIPATRGEAVSRKSTASPRCSWRSATEAMATPGAAENRSSHLP
eukprot:scaffold32710_cov33-Tisochrysis_lutea.AAC.3